MTKQCNLVINLQYIFNLFLNMLKSASYLANLMGGAPYWSAATTLHDSGPPGAGLDSSELHELILKN